MNLRIATILGISQEDIEGPWECKKCRRRGNIWWAAFHLHRKNQS